MANSNRTNWEQAVLKPLVKKIGSGITPRGGAKVYVPNGIPFIRSQNVHENRLVLDDVAFISVAQHELMDSSKVQSQDVLLNITGASIGRSCVIPDSITEANVNQHVCIIRCDSNLNPQFLCQYINSNFGQRQIYSFQAGGNREGLNYDQIGKFLIPLPPIEQQIKIVEVLSAWDTASRQTEKLITAKVKRKRGLMQQLLTGKRRFQQFGRQEWKQVRLGDVFRERCETLAGYLRKLQEAEQEKEKVRATVSLELLSITAKDGVVHRDTLDKRDTSSEDKSKYLRICPGDIGYNTMRMWQGVSGLSELEGIVSPAYTICTPTDEVDGKFASYLFKYTPLVHLFWRYSQGLVADTLSLKFHHFAQIKTLLPPIAEQQRIATVLECCDKEISLLKQQLDALKRQKHGLMQKLLTAQVRVKVNDVEAATVEAG
jgi:type I restriction enzyme S subunit